MVAVDPVSPTRTLVSVAPVSDGWADGEQSAYPGNGPIGTGAPANDLM